MRNYSERCRRGTSSEELYSSPGPEPCARHRCNAVNSTNVLRQHSKPEQQVSLTSSASPRWTKWSVCRMQCSAQSARTRLLSHAAPAFKLKLRVLYCLAMTGAYNLHIHHPTTRSHVASCPFFAVSLRAWTTTLLALRLATILRSSIVLYTMKSPPGSCPLNHRFVTSSLEGRYATQHAAKILWSSATIGSTMILGTSPSFLETRAATPPATVSTQSIPASAIAAEATVIHPLSTFIISQFSSSWLWGAWRSWSPSIIVTMMSTPLLGHRSAMMAPRKAVSRCTPKSRSLESLRGPRRVLVANGAYLT